MAGELPRSPIDPREVTLAYLERRREEWLPHYRRAERAGNHVAAFNNAAQEAFEPIDVLLDELIEIGRTALIQTVETSDV